MSTVTELLQDLKTGQFETECIFCLLLAQVLGEWGLDIYFTKKMNGKLKKKIGGLAKLYFKQIVLLNSDTLLKMLCFITKEAL